MACITCEIASVPNSVLWAKIVFTCKHCTAFLLCWNSFSSTLFFVSHSIFKSTSPVHGSVFRVVQNVQWLCEKCIPSSLKVLASKSIVAEEGRGSCFTLLLKLVLTGRYRDIELHLHSEPLQLCLGILILCIWTACSLFCRVYSNTTFRVLRNWTSTA